jgi:hypothetical protein
MNLRRALDRTLLLMRDEVNESVDDETLLAALTGTHVALIADHANIASHSAQTAFVTSALLMARSGHQVYLLCPDIPMVGPQPPLGPGALISQLMRTGTDLLPGIQFTRDPPGAEVDLAVAFGDSEIPISARRRIRLNARAWSGRIGRDEDAIRWQAGAWPLGGMAAAALAAPEAFKIALKRLQRAMRNPARTDTVFADTSDLEFALAPPETPICNALGIFDCVSGGAIIHATLYVLSRIPGVVGWSRVIEPDVADLTNLNRYMMMLRSHLNNMQKAEDLVRACAGTGLTIEAVNERYEQERLHSIKLGASVLVGVDDIPTRWLVQRANPQWLGVGATTHWSAMASFHQAGLGCAECLHPVDDPSDAPIPTVAFVSFWSGLLTATYFLRHLGGTLSPTEQQIYLTPFRAENSSRSAVAIRAECRSCKRDSRNMPLGTSTRQKVSCGRAE